MGKRASFRIFNEIQHIIIQRIGEIIRDINLNAMEKMV